MPQSAVPEGTPIAMSENNLEAPVPDAVEQHRDLVEDPATAPDSPTSLLYDANEADAVEQHQEVGLDDDDYR